MRVEVFGVSRTRAAMFDSATDEGDFYMWMPPLEDAWQGKVQFYELLFGTWTAYAFLVVLWQRILKEPLDEWRYVLLSFFGAGAFWVNHYFQQSPFWLWLINLYTVFFLVAWWTIAIRGRQRSGGWKFGAWVAAVVYTVVFIMFEQLARYGVENWGMHEFCWMALSFFGFWWLIVWRARSTVQPKPIKEDPYPKPEWRGAGGNL